MTPRVSPLTASRLLFAGLTVPMLALALFEWPSDDDFGSWNMARSVGSPIAFATEMYANWSGRFVTHLLNGFVFARPDLFYVLAFIPVLAFIWLPIELVGSLESFDVKLGPACRWFLAACTLAALFVALWPYLGDCVFWLTGGIGYAAPLLAACAWLRRLARLTSATASWRHLVPVLVGAVPVALLNEQVSAALIAAAAICAFLRRRINLHYALALAVLLAATVVLLAAPGNAARATNGPRGLSLTPASIVINYASVIGVAWQWFIGPALVGVILGAVCALLWTRPQTDRSGIRQWSLVMLAAAFGATLPLAAVPDFAVPRTAFVPSAFLLAGCAGTAFVVLTQLRVPVPRARSVGIGLATCLIATYIAVTQLDWRRAQDAQPRLIARWDSLQAHSNSGTDVTLPALPAERPIAINWSELSTDPKWWANEAVAQFFGLRSVRIVKP